MATTKWIPFASKPGTKPTEDDLNTAWGALYSYFCAVSREIRRNGESGEKLRVIARLLDLIVYGKHMPDESPLRLNRREPESEEAYVDMVTNRIRVLLGLELNWDATSRRWSDSSGLAPKVTLEIPSPFHYHGQRVYAEKDFYGYYKYLVFVTTEEFNFFLPCHRYFNAYYVNTSRGDCRLKVG